MLKEEAIKDVEPKLGDEIPETWTKQSDLEIKNRYRIVNVESYKGEALTVHVHHPTHGEEILSSEEYSKAFSRYLKDPDLMSKKEMNRILKEKGIWGDAEEEIVDSTRERMRDIELTVAKMKKKGNPNKATVNRYRKEWKELREKLHTLLTEQQTILSNTLEGKAEDVERKMKLSLCVKFADGNRLWPNVSDLDDETEKIPLYQIMREATLFWMGLTSEIIDELPVKLIFGGEEEESEK